MQQHTARGAATLGAAVLVLLLTACDGLLGAGDDVLGNQLRANEQKWSAAGPPQSYRLDMIVFQGTDTTAAAVRVHVQNGVVQSANYVATGEPVPAAQRDRYPAVEGLFGVVRDALGRRVSAMSVHYAENYGYPQEISIDYDFRRSDDNLYVVTDNFVLQ
jgi:hypothetical protein